MTTVQRFQIYHTAMTTGMPLLRAMSDKPDQAHLAAKTLEERGERGVEIVDGQTGKAYDIKSFAAEHRLR